MVYSLLAFFWAFKWNFLGKLISFSRKMKIKEVFKRKRSPMCKVKITKTNSNGTLIKPCRGLSFAVLKTFNFYKLILYHLYVFVGINFKWKMASEHFSDFNGGICAL